MSEQVGARLRTLRESRGVSIRALAGQLGVGASTVSSYESGDRELSLARFLAIGSALSATTQELLAVIGVGAMPSGERRGCSAAELVTAGVREDLWEVIDDILGGIEEGAIVGIISTPPRELDALVAMMCGPVRVLPLAPEGA